MTWRHPSITYGAVEPEATSPPPGRRRAAGWAATIIGVGLAASALSLALGGGGLALKAASALVLELRTRPSSHHPPKPRRHDARHVGYCCTAESVAPNGARIGTRGHVCDACVVDNSIPLKCHSKQKICQNPECGSGRFCVGTYKGDVPPPPLPGGTTEGVAQVETAIPALTDSDPGAGNTMMSMNGFGPGANGFGPGDAKPTGVGFDVNGASVGGRGFGFGVGDARIENEPSLDEATTAARAENAMMRMNSGIISCFKRVAEYYPGLHRDDVPTDSEPCYEDAPQTGTKPEHMKYT